jgi:7-dehydrocholesterol reductase
MSHFGGSLQDGSRKFVETWPMAFYNDYLPGITLGPVIGYAGWIAFQGLLYWALPGKVAHSPPTPGGNVLPYRMNGLLSFFLTIAVVAGSAACNGAKAIAGLAENWTSFLVVANAYGLLVALIAQIKGYTMPTCEKDRRMSGQFAKKYL